MKKVCFSLVIFLSLFLFGQVAAQNQENQLQTFKDSVSYGVGSDMGRNLFNSGFDDIDLELVLLGLQDIYQKNPSKIKPEEIQKSLTQYLDEKKSRRKKENTEKGKLFLEENGARPGVVSLPSGLQYSIIKTGNGKKPKESDKVEVHYTGSIIGGKVFDNTRERNFSSKVPVNGVMAGWTEGLQLMPVGSIFKFYIPSHLAFGEKGAGDDIGPNETLIFEIELLRILEN